MTKKKPTKKKSPKKKGDVVVWEPPKELLKKLDKEKAEKEAAARTLAEQVVDAGLIMEACNNDEHTAQFFLIWLQNGRSATDAYLSLHPGITRESAATLGSRELRKVERGAVMEAYGLGFDSYMNQLAAGLQATKIVGLQGDEVEDHKTRREYHKAQGEILGIERPAGGGNTAIQVNVGKAVSDWIVTEK